MLYNPDNLPDDFFDEYLIPLDESVSSWPEYCFYLSDIEIAYKYTVVKASWLHPSQYRLKLPGTLYNYVPDQRPLTLQLLGKPSLGPSPPFPTEYTGMPRAGCGTVKYSYNFFF